MKQLIKIGFWLMGRGVQIASKVDSYTKSNVLQLPENFKITLQVFPNQAFVSWKHVNNSLKFYGLKPIKDPDLTVIIKDRTSALKMILGQLGIAKAYAQRRVAIKGNTVYAMVLTRILDRIEVFLFPYIITKKLLKQPVHLNAKEYLINLRLYLGIFLGI